MVYDVSKFLKLNTLELVDFIVCKLHVSKVDSKSQVFHGSSFLITCNTYNSMIFAMT